ncbi:uncharacterized protein LOC116738676 [Nasonia vitripennis]|uniref:Uncharacterized protein n=1 Tax=Nasonia vitripennis TaxID=7425 RepID=A0A7M7TEN4_NASVI|nr:uncharacterized protein LOC116738676 [Nasonia vitripennis]
MGGFDKANCGPRCKIGDDKQVFTQIATNLNTNLPQVVITLDESLNSNILSVSTSSLTNSNDLEKSNFKHPNVLNVSGRKSLTETHNQVSIVANDVALNATGQTSDPKDVIFSDEMYISEGKMVLTESRGQMDNLYLDDLVPNITGHTSDPKDDVISQEESDFNKGNESFHHFEVYEDDNATDDQYVDHNPGRKTLTETDCQIHNQVSTIANNVAFNATGQTSHPKDVFSDETYISEDDINDNSEAVTSNSKEGEDEVEQLSDEQPQSQTNKNKKMRNETHKLRSGKLLSKCKYKLKKKNFYYYYRCMYHKNKANT